MHIFRAEHIRSLAFALALVFMGYALGLSSPGGPGHKDVTYVVFWGIVLVFVVIAFAAHLFATQAPKGKQMRRTRTTQATTNWTIPGFLKSTRMTEITVEPDDDEDDGVVR